MHPELNLRYKITTCGYCDTDFFYTDKDQFNKHKTCVSKPIQKEFTLNPRKFNLVQLKVVKLEGFSEQESTDMIQKAFTLQTLKYAKDSLEATACIERDNHMWILGSRFSFDNVIQALSNPCNSLLII